MSDESDLQTFEDEETMRAERVPSAPRSAVQALLDPSGPSLEVGPEIARGGMAIVRQGEQVAMRRAVAVKVAKSGESPDALVQEAWLTGALEHPNIVPIYDIAVLRGSPHVLMKRIEGEPWKEYIHSPERILERFGSSDPLDWNLRILISVCNALEFAHSQGIIHRDIKPANVMIGRFGQVYLVDWGIALSLRAEDDPRFPRPGDEPLDKLLGTPAFMAPEMALSEDWAPLSERTDVYQLGGVLHCIVSGRPPRRAHNLHELMLSMKAPTPVELDWPLSGLIARALANHPNDRPASVAEVRSDIELFLSRRGTEAIEHGAQVRLKSLLVTLESASEDDRREIYDLYGACRFGFEEVLGAWPESKTAAEGIRTATLAMTRWELVHGDDRSAEINLSRVDSPPTDLLEEVAAARELREAAAVELDQHRHDADSVANWWARIPVGIGMLVVWVGPPVVTGVMGLPEGYLKQTLVSVSTAFGTFALIPLFWPWMRGTRYNRVLVAACVMSPVLTAVFLAAAWLGDVPGDVASALRVFVFVLTTMVVTAFADWRFFPSVLGFAGALFVGAANPGWSEAVLGLANLACIFNVLALVVAGKLGSRDA